MELCCRLLKIFGLRRSAFVLCLLLLLLELETLLLFREMAYLWLVEQFSINRCHLTGAFKSSVNVTSPWLWPLEVLWVVIVLLPKRRRLRNLSFIIFKILKLLRTIILWFILCWLLESNILELFIILLLNIWYACIFLIKLRSWIVFISNWIVNSISVLLK